MTPLLLAFALAAPGPKGESKPASDDHPLLGEWVVEEEVSSGKPVARVGRRATVTIARDRWKYFLSSGAESCLSVDPKKDPPQIDFWNPTQGDEEALNAKGIYKLDGDTLTIYYSYKDRPTKFESLPKSGVRMMTLRRVKKN